MHIIHYTITYNINTISSYSQIFFFILKNIKHDKKKEKEKA